MPDPLRGAWGRPLVRFGVLGTVAVAAVAAIVIPVYLSVPLSNNRDPTVDCLLVLGSPTEIDGTLTESQRWRVDEAVREFRAGRAPCMLITGGMTSRNYIEAETMGSYAESLGVPPAAILEETHAKTTMENIRASQVLLDAHGWRRVEVISSPEHLPRASLLLAQSHLLWQMHAAPTPGRGLLHKASSFAEEAMGTAIMRLFGPRIEPVLHAAATLQHGTAFTVRWVWYKAAGWSQAHLRSLLRR